MKNRKRLTFALWLTVMLVCTVIFGAPLYYTVVNSLRSIHDTTVFYPKGKLEWINYKYALTLIPFFRYFVSSCIIVAITEFFALTFQFFYGFAFARLKARGKNILFLILLSQMMIPGFALQIPQYIAYSNLGIKNTYWIWVLTGLAGNAYTIFMYKQYLESIPKEIEEAAFVDGCGYFRMILHIFMPMCKSIMAIGFFSTFTAAWGDYMTPYMYLNEKMYPLAIALFNSKFVLPSNPSFELVPVKLAAALLFAIPTIIAFFVTQKKLVSGITAGSVKG